LRKAFVQFAGKMQHSPGFPQTFNGSDSEKRRGFAYTRTVRPARNRVGFNYEKCPAWGWKRCVRLFRLTTETRMTTYFTIGDFILLIPMALAGALFLGAVPCATEFRHNLLRVLGVILGLGVAVLLVEGLPALI